MQFLVKGSQQLQILLEKYAETFFKPGLVELKGVTTRWTLKPDVNPKFANPDLYHTHYSTK